MTKKQRQNLAKLTLFVHRLPQRIKKNHFNMNAFFMGINNYPSGEAKAQEGESLKCLLTQISNSPSCGTSGCFCGWGPAAGIKPKKQETWWQYARRAFGADGDPTRNEEKENVWNTLFNNQWHGNADDAVKRGAWLLQTNTHFEPLEEPEQFDKFQPNFKIIEFIAEGKL